MEIVLQIFNIFQSRNVFTHVFKYLKYTRYRYGTVIINMFKKSYFPPGRVPVWHESEHNHSFKLKTGFTWREKTDTCTYTILAGQSLIWKMWNQLTAYVYYSVSPHGFSWISSNTFFVALPLNFDVVQMQKISLILTLPILKYRSKLC